MRMKVFIRNPIGELFNEEDLRGAVHVETYTKDEGRFGGDRTLVIFAFYNDEEISLENHILFSKRLDIAKNAENWCLSNNVKLDPLGIVTALHSLGHLKAAEEA